MRTALGAGADIAETDSKGRLATHIAAFASNEAALAVLAEADADMNALEYQLYDVTIAAVVELILVAHLQSVSGITVGATFFSLVMTTSG
ncbi:MAG: hypothetical protein HKN27_14635 [Silicimonas sp.]|nr:hypothetical protein [Silicimonas sp.]